MTLIKLNEYGTPTTREAATIHTCDWCKESIKKDEFVLIDSCKKMYHVDCLLELFNSLSTKEMATWLAEEKLDVFKVDNTTKSDVCRY